MDLNSPGFDNWSYEVVDTKLTQTTKAGTIMQLCVYSDLLAELQGIPPEQLHVVMPNNDPHTPFQKETHKLNDYSAYYRLAKARLLYTMAREVNPRTTPSQFHTAISANGGQAVTNAAAKTTT